MTKSVCTYRTSAPNSGGVDYYYESYIISSERLKEGESIDIILSSNPNFLSDGISDIYYYESVGLK